ncbi:hypothetical protein CHUAL_004338 [Chamberlinius hualienensis]
MASRFSDLSFGIIWTLFLSLPLLIRAESCLQVLTGQVSGGNYTYYRLAHEGNVVLTLRTTSGDADIYVSQNVLQPTFDLESYDLNSVSCGVDEVEIPKTFNRPVGIGIYGHPSHFLSTYELCVNLASDYGLQEYENNSYDAEAELPGKVKPKVRYTNYEKDDEEESLIWAILIGILKVIVEVFM